MKSWRKRVVLGVTVAQWVAGCAAAPRAQLAGSDALDRLAVSLRESIVEFAGDVEAFDAQRQRGVVEAFVERVRETAGDEPALAMHREAFLAALQRIDEDRRAAWERQAAAIENIELLSEIASGLRRLALESISNDQEGRQYLSELAKTAAAYKSHSKGEIK